MLRELLSYLWKRSGSSRDGGGAERSRVLLIEEEPRVADVVSRGLYVDGYEVVVAEDGEVGAFLATTEPFDLMVLDLALSGPSDLELVRRIRGASNAAPVIVLSARDDPEARQECERAGAAAFIAKPLVVEQLRASVKEQLARRRTQYQSPSDRRR
jgi:two-component system, OmpR family, response regulator MprA